MHELEMLSPEKNTYISQRKSLQHAGGKMSKNQDTDTMGLDMLYPIYDTLDQAVFCIVCCGRVWLTNLSTEYGNGVWADDQCISNIGDRRTYLCR